jgi:ATP-dependent RNA helicase HelY
MPARTVVLEKLTKWNGEGHVSITPGEYTQLTGRAGRRGIDIEGNAVVLWSPTVDSATAAGLASTRTYPLRSSFTPSYNMSINLIARFGRERARTSLESSFAQFQADRAVVGLVKQIRKNDLAAAEQLESAICHLGNFEEYASIRMEIKETERLLSKRDQRRTFDNRQRQHMENELDNLRRRLRQHECHSCNDRETHARFAERAARLNRESAGLRERVENRTHVIAKTFDRICDVLTHLGYIEGEKPLEQGKILAKIYAESDLLLTETIRNGVLESLSAPELVSVISSVIYESRGSENYSPKMPHQNVANALASIASIWSQLEDIEEDFGVATQKEPDFGFCYAAYRWASGHSLTSVLKGSDMTVGDFVRNIKQLIDLLTQIAGASDSLRKNCREAIKRIDRGVVSYMVSEL